MEQCSGQASSQASCGVGSPEDGGVTVELALGMVSLMLILALILGAVSFVSAKAGACADAREALRLVVRGQDVPQLPSDVSVMRESGWVTVRAVRNVTASRFFSGQMPSCEISGLEEGNALSW